MKPTTKLVQLHVRIPAALYRRVKVRAAQDGAKLQDLVALMLDAALKNAPTRITDWGAGTVRITKKGGRS